jgi:FkbM family methyltransferase
MRLYRDFRTAKLASDPVETAYGFRFAGNPAFLSPGWEPNQRRIITALLPKVAAFVDVGANHGIYTALAAHAGIQTVAIEPEDGNLRCLKATIAANGFPTEILPVAISDASGVLNLFGDGSTASVVQGWAGNTRTSHRLVPANTLDKLLAARWPGERVQDRCRRCRGPSARGRIGDARSQPTSILACKDTAQRCRYEREDVRLP